MTSVFVAGSITIKHLDLMVQNRLMNVIAQDFHVLVGDADGADSAIQRFLKDNGARSVTVYCTGETPRNNLGDWPVQTVNTYHPKGTRAFFTAKDIAMADAADYGFMVWDARSTGTLSNVIELLSRKKSALVFVNKDKAFHKVASVAGLDVLLGCMAETSRLKADTKMGLIERVEALRSRELAAAIVASRAAASVEVIASA